MAKYFKICKCECLKCANVIPYIFDSVEKMKRDKELGCLLKYATECDYEYWKIGGKKLERVEGDADD